MIARQSSKQKTNQEITKQHQRSFSDIANLKTTSLIHHRLKKQISNKFIKHQTRNQINKSTLSHNRKTSASFLVNNPLTKSSFSVNDAITHKAGLRQIIPFSKQPTKSAMSSSHSRINASYRQRYNKSMDEQLFKTRIAAIQNREATPLLKPVMSARDITTKQYSSVPNSRAAIMQARNNKFKLLFKQKNIQYKTASERKISRIDSKIDNLKSKKTLLQSMMPKQKAKVVIPKIKPKGEVVKKQKIMAMTLSLIKYLQLYFNMYQHNNIVGGQLKNIEGYNHRIKNIFMIDNNRAKRINNVQDITNLFWVFKDQKTRPEYFGEEDLALYNIINNYLLKMEKKYSENITNYNFYQQKKRTQEKEDFRKTYEKFQKKMGKHQQINKINKFVQNRVRHDQDRRQGYMADLQKTGVKLNLIERSRQLILRQREKTFKRTFARNSIV